MIFAPVHYRRAGCQSRFRVIVHVLRRAGGNEMEDVVRGIVRVHDDFAVMIADDAPRRRAALEGAVLNELARGGIGRFDHTDIIQQNFAAVQ